MELLVLLSTEVMFDDNQSHDESIDDDNSSTWIEYEQVTGVSWEWGKTSKIEGTLEI